MPPTKRVTQRDVAKLAGVNRSTVSLAMNHHPSIPIETRERILRLIEKLGYQPDPMLSALAAYRNARQPARFHGTLAWLARSTENISWRKVPHFSAYLRGAMRRAEFHGYRIDPIDLSDHGLSWTRAAQIVRSRGIRGVLLCPLPESDTHLDAFPWDEVSAVVFGYTLTQPKLNAVAPAQYRAAFQTVSEMLRRGYRRIGCVLDREHDRRTDHNYLAGYLAAIELHPDAVRIPAMMDPFSGNMKAWLKQHRPDALLLCNENFLETLGTSPSSRLGIACPVLSNPKSKLAGICELNEVIGETAVDMLVAMMHRSDRGIPTHPQRLLVEGAWVDGVTLPEKTARRKSPV